MDSSFRSKRLDIATVVLFCAALMAPVTGMFLGLGQVTPADEGRTLATLPPVSGDPKSWLQYGDGFKSYFHDRFGFRKTLIGLQAAVKRELLGVSSSPEVIIGRDGWLFYAGGYAMDNYRAVHPFTERELQAYLRVYENRRDFLKRLGIAFIFVVPPEKHSIYPEYLPRSIIRTGRMTRLDQLKEYFKQRSTVSLIDVRPALLNAKAQSDRKLFFKTDTHWTPYGSFIAYREIMAEARRLQPEIKEIPISQLEVDLVPNTGDLERMLGLTVPSERMENVRAGATVNTTRETPQVSVMENSKAGLPKLMMIHDSFGVPLGDLLARHFSRSFLVSSPGATDFNPRQIQREKPDLVIVEVNERALLKDPAPTESKYEVAREPCGEPSGPSGGWSNTDPCSTMLWGRGVENVSLGKPASQSSPGIDPGANAEAAVDGNTNGVYYAHSVMHTGNEPNAWWQVDLGRSVDIQGIAIWNRTDCCISRLSDYWIFVSDVPFAKSDTVQSLQGRAGTWSRHEQKAPDPVSRITTPGARGRYVRVQIRQGPLHMAEVQVFGK